MAYASLIFIRCHYLFANVELKCIFRDYLLDLKRNCQACLWGRFYFCGN